MRRLATILAGLTCVVLLPSAVLAQAGLAGNVKDTSGAVLPGVTVEAASPALIEKTRSVVTDGSGNYKIENLRPGPYTVTFTLPGFNTYRREGIELAGSFIATVNADMKVGAIEESITVTGETPLVDIQSSARQSVLSKDVIDALPTGRSYSALAALLPGVNNSGNDVGAQNGGGMESLSAHGGSSGDMRVLQNGLNVMTLQTGNGNVGGMIPNQSGAQEVAVDVSGAGADRQTGGVAVNYIQRDGGNTFKSYSFFTWGGDNVYVADNLTDRIRLGPYGAAGVTNAPGLSAVNNLKDTWEINPGFGGPIKKDKLWFYYTVRYQRAQDYAAGMYQNLNAFNLNKWTYDCGLVNGKCSTDRAFSRDGWWDDSQLRLTWQANAKNKFAGTWDQQAYCQCPNSISSTTSPESAPDRRFPTQQLLHGEWFSPVTSRLLLEFVGLHRTERWGNMALRPSDQTPTWPAFGGSFDRYFPMSAYAVYPQMLGVTEQNPVNGQQANLAYRGPTGTWNNNWVPSYHYRGSMSYVTGTHSLKVGFNEAVGYILGTTYFDTAPIRYRFKSPVDANGNIIGGLPTANQVSVNGTPTRTKNDQDHDLGLYAQDRWTINRLTLSYGIRFDYFKSEYPVQTLPAATIFLGSKFARATDQVLGVEAGAGENLNWKDITPRFGGAYDLFGDGKTAVKFSVNKYVAGQTANGSANTNPVSRLTSSASRVWTDSNKNFIVDCDLLNTAKNGECAAYTGSALNFGTLAQSAVPNDQFRKGWNKRQYNWEFSAGVQRQLLPRVSAEFAYFRRINGGFTVSDNLAWETNGCGVPGDHRGCYDQFNVIAPVDSRLEDVSGKTITGLYDVKSGLQNVTSNNATVLLSDLGLHQYQHWNGFDITANARLSNGVLIQGGVSTGKTYNNNCEVGNFLPESVAATPQQYCENTTPFLSSYRLIGSYTIPRVLVQVSGTFRSNAQSALQAVLTLDSNNTLSSTTLGRQFSAGGQKTVNLLNSGMPFYEERINQLDMRFAKIIKYGRTRTNVSVDLFNAFNQDTITGENTAYETLWRPTGVLQARFLKFSAQFDF